MDAPKDPSSAVSVGYLKDMYAGCMDTATLESVGLGPLIDVFGPAGEFGGWPMVQDSWSGEMFNEANVTGRARRYLDVSLMLTSFVYMDDFDTSHNVISVTDFCLHKSFYLGLLLTLACGVCKTARKGPYSR